MAESHVQVSEGSGKRLHTNTRTISSTEVHDEVVVRGEPYLPSYIAGSRAISGGSAASVLTLNAGATNKLRIRAIQFFVRSSTTAGAIELQVKRITTAATGGTAITPAPLDPSDSAAGATARAEPTGGGAAGTVLFTALLPTTATAPQPAMSYRWEPMHGKPIVVAEGTANGIAVAVVTGVTGCTINAWIEFDETAW